MLSTAGSGHSICWNQPASSSRFSFIFCPSTSIAMMMVACGTSSTLASSTPVCPKPWSSLCNPVRTLGQRLLNRLLHALRPHRKCDHFAAVFFLQPQCFFQRVAIRLVHLETDVGLANPVSRDGQRCVLRGNLLNAHDNIHALFPLRCDR